MIENIEKQKRHGLLITVTGCGKGKTTSALGMCMRALGWGWKVTVIQFVKSSRETGEKRFSEKSGLPFEMFQMGRGVTWKSKLPPEEHAVAALEAWEKAEEYILQARSDLLVLDELNIAINASWIDTARVVGVLKARPFWMNVVATGRNAPAELISASDLVSEINEIKHPYRTGIKAQKGIEY